MIGDQSSGWLYELSMALFKAKEYPRAMAEMAKLKPTETGVRGGMKLDSRKGFRYEVYRSNNEELGPAAGDKAELLWDTVQQSGGSASYSVGKMLGTALLHWKGKKYKTVEDFEEQFDAWVKEGSDMNIRFFCSHFVTFCYHWAAKDIGHTGVFGFDYTIGANKVKISPAELYVRVDQMGLSHFQHKGTLYAH